MDAADRDAPGHTRFQLDVGFERAVFYKGSEEKSGMTYKGTEIVWTPVESRPFIPGMNLYNFMRLGGVWPSPEVVEPTLEEFSHLPDRQPWNFIVGKGITPIDMEAK